jgi:hypothetical protein
MYGVIAKPTSGAQCSLILADKRHGRARFDGFSRDDIAVTMRRSARRASESLSSALASFMA